MRRVLQFVLPVGTLCALAFGAATLFTSAPANAQIMFCGICEDTYFINEDGLVCALWSCNNGPCVIERCFEIDPAPTDPPTAETF